MEIYAVNIGGWTNPELIEQVLSCMDHEERDGIAKFTRPKDGLRTLVGSMLVQTLACLKLQCKIGNLLLIKNPYGKPMLEGVQNFHFNISHSGDWVVYAVDTTDIGIDIELIKPINVMEVCTRFFSLEERDAISQCPSTGRLEFFYELWTLKESYIKAQGKGLSIPLSTFSVLIQNTDISIRTHDKDDKPCSLKLYNIDPDYKMAVCAATSSFSSDVTMLDVEWLCNTFMLFK